MNQEEKIKVHLQSSELQLMADVAKLYKHKMEYYQERDKWQNEALKWISLIVMNEEITAVIAWQNIDQIYCHLKEMLDLINLED